jgi:hypothetical protein
VVINTLLRDGRAAGTVASDARFRRLDVLWVFLGQDRIDPAPTHLLTPTNATGGHAGEDFRP